MAVISTDLAFEVWRGIAIGLALVAMIFGGFAIGSIDGVTVDDDHPPSDKKSPDEGG
jgi:hypothetical protein